MRLVGNRHLMKCDEEWVDAIRPVFDRVGYFPHKDPGTGFWVVCNLREIVGRDYLFMDYAGCARRCNELNRRFGYPERSEVLP